MISSQNTLMYTYAFYLIGRKHFRVAEPLLQRLIGRWFFASTLTGRYTSSAESALDEDLNRLRAARDGEGFVATLEEMMRSELTTDYWTVTLPAELESSAARSPYFFAFVAAQNLLGAPVLFSHKKIQDLLDPAIKSSRKALERHHLFPRSYLEHQGITDLKVINQIANFALLEWPENMAIGDAPPATYVPRLRPYFSPQQWQHMLALHALPPDWEQMPYERFLQERRRRMGEIIRRGYESLSVGTATPLPR